MDSIKYICSQIYLVSGVDVVKRAQNLVEMQAARPADTFAHPFRVSLSAARTL